MHVFGPGYTGIAAVAPDRVNVNTVVPASWLRRQANGGVSAGGSRKANGGASAGGSRERRRRLYLGLLRACPAVRRVVEEGRELYPPVASDVTFFAAARASADRILLAGDAALFLDPFTGQGIYLALRSAELAFEVGCGALRAGDTSRVRLAAYDALRHAEFAPKVRLSRLLQTILYRPWLARRVAAALRRDRLGARRLIGVVGDYLPAAELLRPDFLGRLAASALL